MQLNVMSWNIQTFGEAKIKDSLGNINNYAGALTYPLQYMAYVLKKYDVDILAIQETVYSAVGVTMPLLIQHIRDTWPLKQNWSYKAIDASNVLGNFEGHTLLFNRDKISLMHSGPCNLSRANQPLEYPLGNYSTQGGRVPAYYILQTLEAPQKLFTVINYHPPPMAGPAVKPAFAKICTAWPMYSSQGAGINQPNDIAGRIICGDFNTDFNNTGSYFYPFTSHGLIQATGDNSLLVSTSLNYSSMNSLDFLQPQSAIDNIFSDKHTPGTGMRIDLLTQSFQGSGNYDPSLSGALKGNAQLVLAGMQTYIDKPINNAYKAWGYFRTYISDHLPVLATVDIT